MNHTRSERPVDIPQQHPPQVIEVVPLPEVFSGVVISERPSSGKGSGPVLIVDGEVITTNTVATGPDRNMFQRVAEDPYWVIMTMLIVVVALGAASIGLIIYRMSEMVRMVAGWLNFDGTGVALGVIVLMSALVMAVGGVGARCAGSHCGGCERQ